MSLSSVYSWIEAPLAAGVEIVTASNRLARTLRAAHTEQQLAAGRSAWPTPAICDWNSWLRQNLDSVAGPVAVPRRLDRLSASLTWEEMLINHVSDRPLNTQGLVRHAMTAWQLASDWGISLDEICASATHDDARVFANAARDYGERLDREGLVDSAGLPGVFESVASRDVTLLAKSVIFCGFDRLVPALQRVADAIANGGGSVDVYLPESGDAHAELVAFDDAESELRAAGAWAREIVERDPQAQIAVVVPDLDRKASRAGRLVQEGLVPCWQFAGNASRNAVNVAHGQRLLDVPAVEFAFDLLNWVVYGAPGRHLSVLLRSSYLSGGTPAANARAELALRENPDRTWTAASLSAVAVRKADGNRIAALVAAASEFNAACQSDSTPASFAAAVDQLLTTLDWPGADKPDTRTWQLVNRWRNLLNEFSRVAGVRPRIATAEALSLLQSLAAETIWQPESTGGLINVLAPRDTFGMSFDAVWVSGMDASRWPLEGHPSPLLSRRLQRDYDMPNASPAATLEFSERLLNRLTSATSQLVLSRARYQSDGELAPSPLLDRFSKESPVANLSDPGWSVAGLVSTASYEVIVDDEPPPVAPDEKVRGGAYTIQRQFQDPLSAFVQGRLGVRAPEPFREGLSPALHGRIVHDVLEALYRHGPSRSEIAAWDQQESSDRVGAAIDSVLGEYDRQADDVFRRLLAIERTYLRELLSGFLDIEMERAEFQVAATEDARTYQAAGISFGIRIDRIDQLSDGNSIIIDYKTGDVQSFVSREGELRDLQPVVYAAALEQEVGALLFAAIDSRSTRYLGCGDAWAKGDMDWPATLASWMDFLQVTVQDFARGDIRTDPGEMPGDGRELALLSRVEEIRRG